MGRDSSLFALMIALMVFGTACQASAQSSAIAFQPRDWAGRPVTRSCNASPNDLAGLRTALIEHERAKVGFNIKMDTGWFYGNRLRLAPLEMKKQNVKDVLQRIEQNLRDLSTDGDAGVLIYDAGWDGRDAMVCAWLITKDGVRAAETVRMRASSETSPGRLASYSQDALGVTAVQFMRSPRRPGSERHASGNIPVLTPTASLLSGASDALLPRTIQTVLLTQSINRLLILPSADIGTVPYYALPVGNKQLIDLATVVILSGTEELFVYADLHEKVQERGSKLVIGNPDSRSDAWKWDDLPGATLEAKAIDELTPSMRGDVLIGGEANKDKVLHLLSQGDASLIYFATHGYADAVDPMSGSFLLLSEGRLLAKEVGQQIRLYKAPIVVMSACQSGLGKVFEGGMFGLARAWRNVGASQVVMSLWDVNDLGTKRLMVEFMDKVLAGARPEDALREASLKARDEWGFPPGVWAEFAVFGVASR
jgi:hypothetical protein